MQGKTTTSEATKRQKPTQKPMSPQKPHKTGILWAGQNVQVLSLRLLEKALNQGKNPRFKAFFFAISTT